MPSQWGGAAPLPPRKVPLRWGWQPTVSLKQLNDAPASRRSPELPPAPPLRAGGVQHTFLALAFASISLSVLRSTAACLALVVTSCTNLGGEGGAAGR